MTDADATDPTYWTQRQLCGCVRYAPAVEAMACSVLVEMGPRGVNLRGAVSCLPRLKDAMPTERDEMFALLDAVGFVWRSADPTSTLAWVPEEEGGGLLRLPLHYPFTGAPLKQTRLHLALPAAAELDDALLKEYRSHDLKAYHEFTPVFETLSHCYIADALLELGLPLNTVASTFTTSEAAEMCHIDPHPVHRAGFPRYLELLADAGVLRAQDAAKDSWVVVAKASEKLLPAQAFEEKHHAVLTSQPDFIVLAKCGRVLSSILTGRTAATSVLFDDDTFTKFYRTGVALTSFNRAVRTALERILAAAKERLPGAAAPHVRILEIGGGTGSSTSHLLDMLTAVVGPTRLTYTFTDISNFFLSQARAEWQTKYPWIEYKILDISKQPTGSVPLGSYDIIIANNVMHTTGSIAFTVEHGCAYLRPGGLFMLVEVTKPTHFLDVTVGTTEGWQLFETCSDPWRKGNRFPGMSVDRWRELFTSLGQIASPASFVCTSPDVPILGSSTLAVVQCAGWEKTREHITIAAKPRRAAPPPPNPPQRLPWPPRVVRSPRCSRSSAAWRPLPRTRRTTRT
eukprot:GAFH01001082.1.p1 GENE.GAFH01001082.1~~GAFH01001082.1.p1  ORF type:complete len:607 (-),score=164.40 GAFH01001082.1:186-1895(-)